MKHLRLLVLTIVLAIAAAPLRAQETAPAAVRGREDVVMPELKFDGIPFDDMMEYLRDVTEMNIVVQRARGTPADYPKVGKIRLTKVTPTQFFAFLETAYGVGVRKIEGPAGPLFVVSINAPPGTGGGLFGGNAQPQQEEQPHFRIFDLAEAINTVRARNSRMQNASEPLEDVMSLLQAALDQSGQKTKPTLTVHKATQTLLFRGTQESARTIENSLQALRSKNPPGTATSSEMLTTIAAIREAFGHTPDPKSTDPVDIQILTTQLAKARNEQQVAGIRLQMQDEKLKQSKALLQKNFVTESAVKEEEIALLKARSDLSQAEQAVLALQNQMSQNDADLKAQITQLKNDNAELKARLDDLQKKAAQPR